MGDREVRVRVPADAKGGEELIVTLDNGKKMVVIVPDGSAGKVLSLKASSELNSNPTQSIPFAMKKNPHQTLRQTPRTNGPVRNKNSAPSRGPNVGRIDPNPGHQAKDRGQKSGVARIPRLSTQATAPNRSSTGRIKLQREDRARKAKEDAEKRRRAEAQVVLDKNAGLHIAMRLLVSVADPSKALKVYFTSWVAHTRQATHAIELSRLGVELETSRRLAAQERDEKIDTALSAILRHSRTQFSAKSAFSCWFSWSRVAQWKYVAQQSMKTLEQLHTKTKEDGAAHKASFVELHDKLQAVKDECDRIRGERDKLAKEVAAAATMNEAATGETDDSLGSNCAQVGDSSRQTNVTRTDGDDAKNEQTELKEMLEFAQGKIRDRNESIAKMAPRQHDHGKAAEPPANSLNVGSSSSAATSTGSRRGNITTQRRMANTYTSVLDGNSSGRRSTFGNSGRPRARQSTTAISRSGPSPSFLRRSLSTKEDSSNSRGQMMPPQPRKLSRHSTGGLPSSDGFVSRLPPPIVRQDRTQVR